MLVLRLMPIFQKFILFLGGDSVTPTTKMSFGTNSIIAEGATDDAHETTLAFTDPTADRTITFPDETGIVQLTGASIQTAPCLNAVTLQLRSILFKMQILINGTYMLLHLIGLAATRCNSYICHY